MTTLIQKLADLSAAEEFLDYFSIPYEQSVVNVSRLHILKRFYQYLRQADGLAGLDDDALAGRYRELLGRAYEDFVHSTPAREKVFKVFQDADGHSVDVDALRRSRATRPAHK